jgi:putative ATP-binding cassette transporter
MSNVIDSQITVDPAERRRLMGRFWRTAGKFWSRASGDRRAWLLTGGLLAILIIQLVVQYRINVWNRDIFNALEQKDGSAVLRQALLYLPLVCATVFVAVFGIYCRMTTQRLWREWLTNHAIDRWLSRGHYYHLNLVKGEHENPEYRIGEDSRIATDAPIDFAFGILSAFLSAVTFIAVLWVVGGSLDVTIGDSALHIPGFLVIAALAYSILATGSMALIGRQFVRLSEANNQREAEFRYALTRLRENGESIALLGGEKEERAGLHRTFDNLLDSWRVILHQYMRTTFVSTASGLIATAVPVLLCAPKFLAGSMSLGDVMQAASAFAIVQNAFSWLVDNYPRFANWSASARRITSLLVSIDALEQAEKKGGIKLISRGRHDQAALQLKGLSVKLDDGTGVVNEAEVEIAPGEKVLIVGESGTGKSTLVRAIAGLWPWGEGEVVMQRDAKLFMLPQRAYVPLGSLRRATTYPLDAAAVQEEDVRNALESVGLGHLSARLNEEGPWEQTLSGGEKQRLAFARLLIHRPALIVMDEATSALDPASQEKLLHLIHEKIPNATLISVGHRPELEAFHDRKLVLEHRAGGARLIRDEFITIAPGKSVALIRRMFKRGGKTVAPSQDATVVSETVVPAETGPLAGRDDLGNTEAVKSEIAASPRKRSNAEAARGKPKTPEAV